MRYCTVLFVLVTSTLLVGCGSSKDASKSNFQVAIDKAMSKDCVVVGPGMNLMATSHSYPQSFPLTQVGMFTNAEAAKQMNDRMEAPYEALVKAGLLEGKDDQVPMLGNSTKLVPSRTYSLTDKGKKYLIAPDGTSFCASHYKVDEVVEFTQPGPSMGGSTESMAKFTYSATDVADWAQTDDFKSAFPDAAKQLTPKREGSAEMVLMNDGWTANVERGFF